jgi:F5/8 type C domain
VNRLALALALCLAAFACREQPAAPAAVKTAEEVESEIPLENDNLLNTVFGATVIDRDNELHYEESAAHAIDGLTVTSWTVAPGGKLDGTFALAAPTRLRRLGVTLPIVGNGTPATVVIEASLDGTKWFPALQQTFPQTTAEARMFDVPPMVARYLHVSVQTPAAVAAIKSLHATGEETEPYVQPDIAGCWEINFEPARFEHSGARITGTIGGMAVDGGTDGRVYRLMWLQQAMWGYAAVAISPDGKRLTGTRWHEAIGRDHLGDGWIGQRVPCNDAPAIADSAASILRRAGVWRLYGVRFDRQDRILADESAAALDLAAKLIAEQPQARFRVVSRGGAAKLNAVREALRARGTDLARLEFATAGASGDARNDSTPRRVMDRGVELQTLPPR